VRRQLSRKRKNRILQDFTGLSLLLAHEAGHISARSAHNRHSKEAMVLGEISLTRSGETCIHTYTAPEEGWCVNSHIVETENMLVVVDAQYMLPCAHEVTAYAATLGKPVERLYLTHFHPDHILGASAFACPLYALDAVAKQIASVGDRIAREEHTKHPHAIPTRAERPNHIVAPGIEVIDAIRFEFLHLRQAETEDALMIGLPDHGILITQDLIYNRVHVFIGEHAFDKWAAALQRTEALHYDTFLPGHGSPGGPELYGAMLGYLNVARDAYATSADGAELKARLTSAFPDYRGHVLLDHQMRFLFPKRPAAALSSATVEQA
jgi:glyoxylase-like metal-dependent hydrolase (beta-lactamase superfamily II)